MKFALIVLFTVVSAAIACAPHKPKSPRPKSPKPMSPKPKPDTDSGKDCKEVVVFDMDACKAKYPGNECIEPAIISSTTVECPNVPPVLFLYDDGKLFENVVDGKMTCNDKTGQWEFDGYYGDKNDASISSSTITVVCNNKK